MSTNHYVVVAEDGGFRLYRTVGSHRIEIEKLPHVRKTPYMCLTDYLNHLGTSSRITIDGIGTGWSYEDVDTDTALNINSILRHISDVHSKLKESTEKLDEIKHIISDE